MANKFHVNLPVKDLPKSIAFFTGLGLTLDKEFTTDDAAMVTVNENVSIMLLTETFFRTFTKKEIADTVTTTEAIHALQVESREKVDEIVEKAIGTGGKAAGEQQDFGYMYGRGFEDLDGHLWEVMYMDLSAAPAE